MSEPVDLLMLTWNRREYAQKTFTNILKDPSDFRIHWWDNGSTDGVIDEVNSFDDPRIVKRHMSPENQMQTVPMLWFLEQSTSDVVGKVDDDNLVPQGWTETIGAAVRQEKKLGMVGCWTFWMDDFYACEKQAQQKVVEVGDHKVLANLAIGGTGFLMRREFADQYLVPDHCGGSIPFARRKMSMDGYISGWYYPLIWAEHMDDPRSEHCVMNRPNGMNEQAALTARRKGFKTPQEFLEWIKDDAHGILTNTLAQQKREHRWKRSILGRAHVKLKNLIGIES